MFRPLIFLNFWNCHCLTELQLKLRIPMPKHSQSLTITRPPTNGKCLKWHIYYFNCSLPIQWKISHEIGFDLIIYCFKIWKIQQVDIFSWMSHIQMLFHRHVVIEDVFHSLGYLNLKFYFLCYLMMLHLYIITIIEKIAPAVSFAQCILKACIVLFYWY